MQYIDKFLNGKPMYRLVLEGLAILALISIIFGFAGFIAHNGLPLILSLLTLLLACYVSNYIFAKIVGAARNVESVFITALILFFIFAPARDIEGYAMLIFASVVAMASKYILAINKKHIWNPAGVSAFIMSIAGLGYAIWWMATPYLLPFVAILGFLILRKNDKFQLFFSFAAVAIISILGFGLSRGGEFSAMLTQILVSWPLVFFGTVMLTEPLTIPSTNKQQFIYAAIVGFFFGAQFHIGPIYSTPALALVIGNIYSYLVAPRYFARLVLRQKNQLTADIYEFVFSAIGKLGNIPGQYMEWTLPHQNTDSRGNRRYFTVASSPTENNVSIGVRMSRENGSSFKKALLDMNEGESITASRLIGNFVLPHEQNKKLCFIAGGIGVTPFRSMIKYLTDKGERRTITLLYSARSENDFVYKDIFAEAEGIIELKTVYATSQIDAETIKMEVPDYTERMFYISGPTSMVNAFKQLLQSLGVPITNIKTDFFPGFA